MIREIKGLIKRKLSAALVIEDSNLEYLLWLIKLFDQIENVPGHIAEIGVADGRNSILFGKLIKLYGQSSVRNYFGFDTFEGFSKRDLLENQHLKENLWKSEKHTLKAVQHRLKINKLREICYLIKGDAVLTTKQFLHNYSCDKFQKGMSKFALLYIDCNAYKPAYLSMENFLPFLSPNAVICIDEKIQGSETKAIFDFARENNLRLFRKSSLNVPMQITIDKNS